MKKRPKELSVRRPIDLSEADIIEAMKDIPGYLDITPGDFKDLYQIAFRHALSRMRSSVKASDVMTKEVVSVDERMPLREVAEIMALKEVSGVPVVDLDRKVSGVISEKDFLARMGSTSTRTFMGVIATCLRGKACVALPVRAQKAGDIMTSPALTIHAGELVSDVAALFKEKNINRVPVVDGENHLVGIVSRADIVDAFY
jgi:CBS domain-containing protein